MSREQRIRDAWSIINPGASNPLAIASTILEHMRELHKDGGSSAIVSDESLAVMVYQLASLFCLDGAPGAETFSSSYHYVKREYYNLEQKQEE